jgi:hypothetical protein
LRSTTKSVAVTSCLLLALVLSGVAAGATQNASPTKWVSVFCGSVVTWEHTVKTRVAKLESTLAIQKKSGATKLPAARAQLVTFLTDIVRSTRATTAKLKAVGAPDVKNGDKIQAGVLGAFSQLTKAFDDARKSAQKLSIARKQAFARGAAALAATIQSSTNRIGAAFQTLNKYSTKELNDAAKKDKTCAKLGG